MKVKRYYEPESNASPASKWLCDVLNYSGFTQSDLAEKLHMSRQSMSKLMCGVSKLSFCQMTAIIYVCELDSNPERIWREISQEGE